MSARWDARRDSSSIDPHFYKPIILSFSLALIHISTKAKCILLIVLPDFSRLFFADSKFQPSGMDYTNLCIPEGVYPFFEGKAEG